MKKLFVFLLLLSLLSMSISAGFGQGRPRRVGDQRTVTETQPEITSPAPTRAPVLGGANYPNNRQPGTQQDQQPTGPEEVDAGDIIRVNTTLVTIPVTVMDRDGRYIPNLQKEEFRIWEDGVEQDVAFFQSVDKPFSVVLMLDTSPSTQFRLEEIQDAAVSFVNQLRSDDRVMVVSFNGDVNILSDFTTDRRKLQRAIQRAETDDGTSLYDAVDLVINRKLSQVNGRKATDLVDDPAWVEREFIPTIQKRSANIIEVRGLSSAASAANAIINHVSDWFFGTREGDWVSMGIPSDGSYGIPEGVIYGFPVRCEGRRYKIVPDLEISESGKEKMQVSYRELVEEQESIRHLLK